MTELQRAIGDTGFRQFLAEGRLMGSRCTDCETVYCPPRALCPSCHGDQLVWHAMPTEGVLAAFTSIFAPPPAMARRGYGRTRPYCCGLVEFAPGSRVHGRLIGVDEHRPETIRVGTPVTVTFIESDEPNGPSNPNDPDEPNGPSNPNDPDEPNGPSNPNDPNSPGPILAFRPTDCARARKEQP